MSRFIVKKIKSVKLTEFLEEHDLHVTIHEREPKLRDHGLLRFYANINSAEITSGYTLSSISGNGDTISEAVGNMCCMISEQRLVIDAMKGTRREIDVPILISNYDESMAGED